MATHAPQVATAVNGLYDHAIDACIDALGLLPRTRQVVPLRQALYVLGTVIEGSSALFGSRDRRRGPWKAIRSDAINTAGALHRGASRRVHRRRSPRAGDSRTGVERDRSSPA